MEATNHEKQHDNKTFVEFIFIFFLFLSLLKAI